MNLGYRAFYFVPIFMILIGGCTAKVSKITGDYKTVNVKLNRNNNNFFGLVSSVDDAMVSKSSGGSGELNFDLGNSRKVQSNGCYLIKDLSSDKYLTMLDNNGSDPVRFSNDLHNQYIELKSLVSDLRTKSEIVQQNLVGSDAYDGVGCRVIPAGTLPDRPCNPSTVNKVYGAAICSAANIRKENACSDVANRLRDKLDGEMLSLLQVDECDQISNEFLRGRNDAIVLKSITFSTPVADKIAEYSNKGVDGGVSAMFFNPFSAATISVVSGLVNAAANHYKENAHRDSLRDCIEDVVKRCKDSYDEWERDVKDLSAKPKRLYKQCQIDLNNQKELTVELDKLVSDLRKIETKSPEPIKNGCTLIN